MDEERSVRGAANHPAALTVDPSTFLRRETEMVRMRTTAVLGAAVVALVLASCANDGGQEGGGQAGGQPTGEQAVSGGATVAVADGDLGPMLVDSQGRTLYLFLADTGSRSTCYDDCASNWPALVSDGRPGAGDGIDASMLGTTARTDGSTQVTFEGQPLYRFGGDSAAGDANGQGIGGVWYVVSPQGTPIKDSGSGGKAGGGGY
jgi:predicted lipoprotein with Yx(FWY)xxD motif